jgi:DNA-binding FrmR family transcriptional regulator
MYPGERLKAVFGCEGAGRDATALDGYYPTGVSYDMATPNPLEVVYFDRDLKQDLSARLKRIEGQVRGLDRMLQEDQPCPKVLNQLAASQAALHSVGTIVIRNYLEKCVSSAIAGGDSRRKDAVLDELMDVLKKFGR